MTKSREASTRFYDSAILNNVAADCRSIVGPEAGEVMATVQTAMLVDLPYTRLHDAVLTHPTMAEGLGPLFLGVPARTGQ